MDGYQVITQALRTEAPKWDELSASVAEIRREVQSAWLGPLAFFVGDPVALNFGIAPADIALRADAYEDFRMFIETALSGAESEFTQLADVLIKIAGMYDEAEREKRTVEFGNISELFSA